MEEACGGGPGSLREQGMGGSWACLERVSAPEEESGSRLGAGGRLWGILRDGGAAERVSEGTAGGHRAGLGEHTRVWGRPGLPCGL